MFEKQFVCSSIKKQYQLLLALFLILFSSSLFAQENEFTLVMSEQDERSLKEFVHALFFGSQGGYVLYGDKPVCTEHYTTAYSGGLFSVGHHFYSSLSEGMRVWKKLGLSCESPQFLFVSKQRDPEGLDTRLLVINKEAFKRVFEEHAVFFRYHLGSQLTAEQLLNELVYGQEDFFSILKHDNVLIGLLLGFGMENALVVSRTENMRDALFKETKNKFSIVNHLPFVKSQGDFSPPFKSSLLKPSIGFSSLEEEIQTLEKQTRFASIALEKYAPQITFGRVSDSPYNMGLVGRYEETQLKLIHLLDQPDYLEAVLSQFYGKKMRIQVEHVPQEDVFAAINMPNLVAKCLLTHYEFDFPYDRLKNISKYIEGMQAAEQRSDAHYLAPFPWRTMDFYSSEDDFFWRGFKAWSFYKFYPHADFQAVVKELNQIESVALVPAFYKAAQRLHAVIFENIKSYEEAVAQAQFQTHDPQMSCLVKDRLYYKQINPGTGAVIKKDQKINFSYKLLTMNHHLIEEQKEGEVLDLSRAIKGFRIGLVGKRVGEKGILFIHPDWGFKMYHTPPYYSPYLTAEFEIHETNSFSQESLE